MTNAASNQQLEPRLLPCPLFGHMPSKDEWPTGPYIAVSGAPDMPKFYAIACPNCCSTAYDEDKERVIRKWNSRVSDRGVVATVDDMKAACDEAVASLSREGKWTAGDVGNYTAAFYSGWYARETFIATASPAAPKEEARTKCANCGESIIRDGDTWDHEFEYRPECLNATPTATPSPDAAREAAKEIVPDCLSRTCFIRDCDYPECWGCNDAEKERTRVAEIIQRHCFPTGGESES